MRFERGGDGAGFGGHADLGTRLADRGHAGADGQLAGDEVRATRRATRLRVVVGEQHAFLGELVEVRRPPGHHAAMVLSTSPISMRRFPPPWTIEQIPGGFKVIDANGQSLAYVYSRDNDSDALISNVLTTDEARRIASNIAKLPRLLKKGV